MKYFETEKFETSAHNEELDYIFNQDSEDFDGVFEENRDLAHDLKTYFRFLRRKYSSALREKMQKNFINIAYLTLDCPNYTPNSSRLDSPLEYIDQMRKQYPDNDITVIIPIIDSETPPEHPFLKFDFFLQNRNNEVSVCRLPKNKLNIEVYGIYSPAFSSCKDVSELSRLQYLAPFLKAARIAIKKIGFDIVHSENIPFFLGGEFEAKFPSKTKVLQVIRDFTQIDVAKSEAFWAAINLADKNGMKKLCRDQVIKKCVASLFNLHNTRRFYQMKDCLKFIYKNYYKFRKYIDKGEDIDENIIFNRLNTRTLQLFPQLAYGEQYFNPFMYTLKRADKWVTISKTYYKEIFESPNLSGKMYKQIIKTKEKSTYIGFGIKTDKYTLEDTGKIYQAFNSDNFRELRGKNKIALLKEFSAERIKTGFVDTGLFEGENAKIYGYLDSFYDSPLIFAHSNAEIFANGVDITFNTILKLFELHKNIQVIISIQDGIKVNFIKSWVDFLSQNKYLAGRWVFIDGKLNLPKFLASADMTLIPRRANMASGEHYLAMHYGCVPIVSRSGILNDTVSDIFDDITYGCGFKTKTGLLSEEDNNELFLSPVLKALGIYQNNPSSWNLLIKNCMNHDSGWSFKILEKYNRIYKDLI